jgi:thiol-disulfide isomerase/thioredoxin
MLSRRSFVLTALAGLGAPPAFAALSPKPDALVSLTRLPGIDGPAIDAAAVSGRPVLLTFWASWCPPCTDEFRHFNRVVETYGRRGLTVLGVNVFEDFGGLSSPAKRARFIRRTAPRFPLLEGDAGTRAVFGGVTRIPTVLLFDAAGEVVFRFIHEQDAAKMHVTFDDLAPYLDVLL